MALVGLVLILVVAWLAGGLANLAADYLPARGESVPAAGERLPAPGRHFLAPLLDPFRGRARTLRAPLVEAGAILLFGLAWFLFRGNPVYLVVACAWSVFFLTILVIDLEHRLVLNVMLIPAAIVALLLSFLTRRPDPLSALLGGALGLVVFFLLALVGRGALGMGDVKLAGVIGLATGYPTVIIALVGGIVLGGLSALLLLALHRATRKSYIAYAPYLSAGAVIALFRMLGR